MAKNTGKVREKSGNFVSLEKWEPCNILNQMWKYAMILLFHLTGCENFLKPCYKPLFFCLKLWQGFEWVTLWDKV